MAKVVGIHGISQQFTTGPQLTREWHDAVRGGLEVAGFRSIADRLAESDVRVAHFGDLFRPKGAMAGPEGPPLTEKDVKPGPEQDLLTALYDEAVQVQPELGPPTGGMGVARVSVQVMLRRLAKSKTFAGVVQRRFIGDLKQVNKFLSVETTKEQAIERVHAEIDASTRVLVGHSLGSVVAYEYLCRYQPASVQLLITIGSPLGIPNIVFDRLTPVPANGAGAWPGDVAEWVNVADIDDVVALRKDLRTLFPLSDGTEAIQDYTVDNGPKPHAADRYLNSEQVGRALAAVVG